jgi:hypothetical protein
LERLHSRGHEEKQKGQIGLDFIDLLCLIGIWWALEDKDDTRERPLPRVNHFFTNWSRFLDQNISNNAQSTAEVVEAQFDAAQNRIEDVLNAESYSFSFFFLLTALMCAAWIIHL